jgi:hypothetical protein
MKSASSSCGAHTDLAAFSINLVELLTLRSVTFEGKQLNAEQFSKRGYSETAIAAGCWTQTPGDRNVASAIEMRAGAGMCPTLVRL